MKNSKKGSTLIMTVILTFSLVIVLAAYMQNVASTSNYINTANIGTEAFYAANAGIEQLKYYVKSSSYSSGGNDWLIANSSSGGTLAIINLPIGSSYKVNVIVKNNGNGTYTATSEAYYYRGPTDTVGSLKSKVAIDIRGRDLFSKFMFFTHLDSINFGTTTVRGDVHSNKSVYFSYGGAKMYGDVTCCTGIKYQSGATKYNTSFFGEVNGAAKSIPWPNTNEIATLHDVASGVYQVSNASPVYSGLGSFNTEIEFLGNQVKITAKKPSTGEVLKTGTYPIPPNNLIFVQGAITSLKGDINGRVTVATMDKVDVTGKIRYLDSEGDRAYVLTDAAGNIIEDTPSGVVWSEDNGYYYNVNPNYDTTNPSTLGIMSLKDITVTSAAPYNMELHAAIFSSNGNWHCDLSQKKGNIKIMGSISQKNAGWRYDTSGYGWAKSGEYLYDETLLSSPPSHFLQVDKPLFGAWRKIW